MIRPMLLVAALSAVIAPGLAAQELPAALSACRAEQDDARRLACYDREVDRQVPPPAAAEERFGYEGALARKEQDELRKEEPELAELHSKAAGISTRPNGTLVITLENGQVWRQNAPESYFPLKIGDPVRIRPAAMGSFLLFGNSRRSIRVTRLR
ncbi:MAG: hypothetical protein EXR87_03185 [Gammaproteobacteria bacterium]|nr:hypothetical protein [Gammaproteobacteria bacterium]